MDYPTKTEVKKFIKLKPTKGVFIFSFLLFLLAFRRLKLDDLKNEKLEAPFL
jgi:hypothetical protein